jgi:cell division protein FtsQ
MIENRKLQGARVGFESRTRDGSSSPADPRASFRNRSTLWQWARAAFGLTLALAMSAALAFSARHYARNSPRFALAEVSLHGAEHRSPSEIAMQAGLSKGENIFSLDPEDMKRRLLADPWIVDARLTRRLPGTMDVEVTERRAAALVAIGETFLATREGVMFKRLDASDPTDLPVVTGLDVGEVADDRKAAENRVRIALDLAEEYAALDVAQRYPLGEVHLKSNGTISLVIGHTAITVELGSPPYRRKLEQASRVVREAERRNMRVDAVLVDNDVRPERVVIRMR